MTTLTPEDPRLQERVAGILTSLRAEVTAASTEDEAREVTGRMRAWARRLRAKVWEPYPWQHPHLHPPGWVSTRNGKGDPDGVCDPRCHNLPAATVAAHGQWLELGGRGTGKTEGAAHYINRHVEAGPACDTRVPGGHRLTIVAPTQADAVASCITGVSGLQAINPGVTITTTREGTIARWPNGAIARVLGAHSPLDVERLRAWTNVCVAEGTPVQTEHGLRPIESLAPGDLVWTRTGLRPVLRVQATGYRPVVRVTAPGANVLVTPDHPVARPGGDFTHADQPGSVLVWHEHESSTEVSGGPSGQTATTSGADASCIAPSGRTKSDPSRRGGTSTTATPTTRPPRTRSAWSRWTRHATPRPTPTRGPLPGTAREAAPPPLPALKAPRHEHSPNGCAACAMGGSPPSAGPAPAPVPRRAEVSPPTRHATVWDLAVEGHHEFYAGGLLVGNCCVWVEEAAAMRQLPGVLEQAPYTLRLGDRPHSVVSTTPKNRPEVHTLLADPKTIRTKGRTRDAWRLVAVVRDALNAKFGGTTQGRQELDADLIGDVEGALWVQQRVDLIDGVPNPDDRPGLDNDRVPDGSVGGWTPHAEVPDRFGIPLPEPAPAAPTIRLEALVIGVDPAGGATENGISVVGVAHGHGYVVDDLTVKGGPDHWGKVAVLAYLDYGAVGIAMERTYGGDQTEHVIRTAAEALGVPMPPMLKAPTQEGKKQRALPIQALSQQHRFHLLGFHPLLEGEMTGWVEDETPESPNRLDAMVHAARHLLVRARPAKTASPVGRRRTRGANASWGSTTHR